MVNEPEPEVIRHQMQVQRAALADKLETLENRIVETVDGAREAVADTVETVRESVRDSVDSVKDSVQSSVHAVQDTFDLPRQVDRHPWTMFGGAVAVGFAAGCILNRTGEPGHARTSSLSIAAASPDASARRSTPSWSSSSEAHAPVSSHESWVDQLMKAFGPEIQKLKGMAVGAVMGVVREVVVDPMPEPMRPQVKEMFDNITTKLGGDLATSEALQPLVHNRLHDGFHNGHHRDEPYGDTMGDNR